MWTGVALTFAWLPSPSCHAPQFAHPTAAVRAPAVLLSELEELTVAELKEKLREAGLPVSGAKRQLINRLEPQNAAEDEPATLELIRPPTLTAEELAEWQLTESQRRRLQPVNRVNRQAPPGREDITPEEERGWGDRAPGAEKGKFDIDQQ